MPDFAGATPSSSADSPPALCGCFERNIGVAEVPNVWRAAPPARIDAGYRLGVVTGFPVLERSSLAAIAELCRRGISESLTVYELDGALFGAEQPAVVRGDPGIGVVATVDCDDGAHLRLLVVDPEMRRRGHGRALLRAAEGDARAAGSAALTVGADAPFFLWAGVPSANIELVCLFERHHYERVETNFDMTIDLAPIPDDIGGHVVAGPSDRDEVDTWMSAHWRNWRAEVLRALDKGNLVIARDDADLCEYPPRYRPVREQNHIGVIWSGSGRG